MPLKEDTADTKPAKQVPVYEDRDGDGVADVPAARQESGQVAGDIVAQAVATMQAVAEDIALTEEQAKKFTIHFDQVRPTSGTGPRYEEATLANMRAALLKLDASLAAFPVTLQTVRKQGYIFDNSLEREIATLNQQWDATMPKIMNEILQRSQALTALSIDVERRFPWDGTGTEPPERTRAIWDLEQRISSAESSIRGMYDKLEEHIQDVEGRLRQAQQLMDLFAQAGFRLQPNEYPVAACPARYLTDTSDEEGPNGFLFLTDQRLIFEQNEDVVREKKLFLVTKKEHIQAVKLEVPVGAITRIEAEDKGFMGRKDFLILRFQEPPAPRPGARFHIQGSNEKWVALINKVISGEIDSDRVGARTMVERVAAEAAGGPPAEEKATIPTNCPQCGAPIRVRLVRGMTSITCEFCGAQIGV